MSKKNYVLVAKCIKHAVDTGPKENDTIGIKMGYDGALRRIVDGLVSEFQQDNPKFDRAKFIKACGIKEMR